MVTFHRMLFPGVIATILSVSFLACGSEPDTKTMTWDSTTDLGSVSFEVPVGWEWDTDFNEGNETEAARVQSGEAEEGFANATIIIWQESVNETVKVKDARTAEDEDGRLLEYETWQGEVNGVPAIFRRVDIGFSDEFSREEFVAQRLLEVYIMPEGDEWAWWVWCAAMVGHEHNAEACKTLVNSVRLG